MKKRFKSYITVPWKSICIRQVRGPKRHTAEQRQYIAYIQTCTRRLKAPETKHSKWWFAQAIEIDRERRQTDAYDTKHKISERERARAHAGIVKEDYFYPLLLFRTHFISHSNSTDAKCSGQRHSTSDRPRVTTNTVHTNAAWCARCIKCSSCSHRHYLTGILVS